MRRRKEFVLAQTNLQLYRQLIEAGWSDGSLAQVRDAYDLVRRLFVGCYRPNQKCFSAHLVGTASALAAWGQPQKMVIAGLLHSAYLFGEFGGTARGVSEEKRQLLSKKVGAPAESLIERYTVSKHTLLEAPGVASPDREVKILRLADLYDECIDAGPRYSPQKRLVFGLPADFAGRSLLIELADELVGSVAANHFRSVFEEYDVLKPPVALTVEDRTFHTIRAGVSGRYRSRLYSWIEGLASFLGRRAR